MKKSFLISTALLVSLSFFTSPVFARGGFRDGRTWENASGGTSGVAASGVYGPNGGTASARGYQSDGQGNVRTESGRVLKTPGGLAGARASTTTKNADGTGTRRSALALDGKNGALASQGTASKTATGVEGTRSTTATSKATGQTYSGSTSYEYDKTTGSGSVSHKCYDSAGNEIACPKSK